MLYRGRWCRTVFCLFVVSLFLHIVGCTSASNIEAVETGPISVLIVDGHSNHNWQYTTILTNYLLERDGRFTVDVSTVPVSDTDAIWDPDFSAYDVVIQNYNDARSPKALKAWPESVKAKLLKYVREGGGLFVLHSANNAFADWPDYREMIGLGWQWNNQTPSIGLSPEGEHHTIPAGEGKRTSHGPRYDTKVSQRSNHPIHANLPQHWTAASLEVYRYSRGPSVENVDVLTYAQNRQHGDYWPIEWVVTPGEGRVYNSTYGHVWREQDQPVSFQCAAFQTVFIRAMQWLAGRPVDQTVPADFPSGDQASLRDDIPSLKDAKLSQIE